MKYDFSGWATKNNLKCSDGLTIVKDAFKENNGRTVPLIWNHEHSNPDNVLGHAMLENRDDGVYAYCTFNTTPSAQNAKDMVEHGDIVALSIYANQLKKQGAFVMHGQIREVSLVLAGANPGAFIDDVIVHGMPVEDEAVLFTGESIELYHADKTNKGTDTSKVNTKTDPQSNQSNPEEPTIQEVFDTFTDEQKNVVYAIVGAAVEDAQSGNDGTQTDSTTQNNDGKGGKTMKHNVFNNQNEKEDVLSHSDIQAIFADGKRYGSLKDSVLAHGIENIDYLFPDFKNVTDVPGFIQRPNTWVDSVLAAVHHTPFSRIKSTYADITEDDARARGYIKGNLKKEEVFSLLKRTTGPTTIYKKQKLDRDDAVDITDFDVVAWLKTEMRMMLNEEIARALLIGDGRSASSDDKINEQNIRPIWTDEDLYTIKASYDKKGMSDDVAARTFIKTAVKARKNYKGSGQPVLYTTEDILTSILLMEDTTGRIIYDSIDKIKSILRVSDIVTVPSMENLTRTVGSNTMNLEGIFVNLADYNVGADKGGAVNMFDDFDIDYNAQKYLIETRCSGALIKPYAAIVVESYTSAS